MNENVIEEINKKRKKFLKVMFYLIAILFIASVLLALFEFKQMFIEHPLFAIILELIFLLPFPIAIQIVYRHSIKKDISMSSIYAFANKITKFKQIPFSNQENREYDSYLPSEIDWSKLPVPPEKILFSTILQKFDIYNIELRTMFKGLNELQQEINLCDLTVFKDFHFGNPEKEFAALILTIKTSKNLNSITYLQTHFAWKEDFDIELSKINLGGNIDVYSNNADIAKKLLTPELAEILNKLKKQFKVEYAKAVFYNEYIVFVLRSFDEMEHNYFPVNISLLTPFDISKAGKAVKNFQTLYDLANQAPEFTKNV